MRLQPDGTLRACRGAGAAGRPAPHAERNVRPAAPDQRRRAPRGAGRAAAVRRRRRGAPQAAGETGEAVVHPDGCGGRCLDARPAAQVHRRRAGLRARGRDHRYGGVPASGQRRAALARAAGNAAAVRGLRARRGAQRGTGGGLPFQPGRTALRISGRTGPGRLYPPAMAGTPHLGIGGEVLSPGHSAAGPQGDPARARTDPGTGLRALFPYDPRPGPARQRAGHPVPGAGQRGQFRGLFLPGHYRRGPGEDRSSVRAFHFQRSGRTAGHRRGLRARAARGSHSVPLPALRTRTRRSDRHGHSLPPAQRPAGDRQGAGAAARDPGCPGRPDLGARGRLARRGPAAGAGPGPGASPAARHHRNGCRTGGLSPSSVPASGRHGPDQRPPGRGGAHRQRGDGRAHHDRVGQERPGRTGDAEGGRARPGHADLPQKVPGPAWPAPWPPSDARFHPRGRPGRVRHAVQGGRHRRVPGGKPGADELSSAHAPALLLRPGDRGGDRSARTDTGQHGSPVPAPPARRGAGVLSLGGA